jgi:hypothetical protein
MAEPTLSKKRYVPIAEGAKISGYTYEYIHRLCRIGKIPCRLMGEKTIVELDALLLQTGTILLGGEHLGFIEVDEHSPYPLIAPAGEASVPKPEAVEKTESRFGHIAVVGEMVHAEEEVSRGAQGSEGVKEKFPSNALPFFSSVGKKVERSGFHIPISRVGATSLSTPVMGKSATHLSITKAEGEVGTVSPRASSVKGLSVMPHDVPAGFIPNISIPPVSPPPPVPKEVVEQVQHTMTLPHDHEIERYASKLPELAHPTSLMGKVLLAVFAFGILVAPTTLGLGNILQGTLQDFGGALRAGARTTMAAVGLIDPSRESALFPYLVETSRLLSASGASGNTATQNGIVITPSTGNVTADQQIKDAVQKTFSDPVQVIPDGKDGQSGIIRPVFQKNNSGGYLYMMVPVRN